MSLSVPTSPFSPQALLGTFLCGLPTSHTDDSAARRPKPHLQEWPAVARRVGLHTCTHTHSPTFPPNPRPVPAPGGWTFENCKGPFLAVAGTTQGAKQDGSKEPAASLGSSSQPWKCSARPQAGLESYLFLGKTGLAQGTPIAQPRGGQATTCYS